MIFKFSVVFLTASQLVSSSAEGKVLNATNAGQLSTNSTSETTPLSILSTSTVNSIKKIESSPSASIKNDATGSRKNTTQNQIESKIVGTEKPAEKIRSYIERSAFSVKDALKKIGLFITNLFSKKEKKSENGSTTTTTPIATATATTTMTMTTKIHTTTISSPSNLSSKPNK